MFQCVQVIFRSFYSVKRCLYTVLTWYLLPVRRKHKQLLHNTIIWYFQRARKLSYILLTLICTSRVSTAHTSFTVHVLLGFLPRECGMILKMKTGRIFTLHRRWNLTGRKQCTQVPFKPPPLKMMPLMKISYLRRWSGKGLNIVHRAPGWALKQVANAKSIVTEEKRRNT